MNEHLSTAFLVLAVGMITVFVILSLVVLAGNVLIRVVNRYFPADSRMTASAKKIISAKNQIKTSELAAVVAAVDIVTKGRGIISKIEKTK